MDYEIDFDSLIANLWKRENASNKGFKNGRYYQNTTSRESSGITKAVNALRMEP